MKRIYVLPRGISYVMPQCRTIIKEMGGMYCGFLESEDPYWILPFMERVRACSRHVIFVPCDWDLIKHLHDIDDMEVIYGGWINREDVNQNLIKALMGSDDFKGDVRLMMSLVEMDRSYQEDVELRRILVDTGSAFFERVKQENTPDPS